MVDELIVMSKAEFVSTLREVLAGFGLGTLKELPTVTKASLQHDRMCTRTVKKYLKEKGYRVSGHVSFKALMKEYKIQPQRRGKDNWYNRVDIERIPPKE